MILDSIFNALEFDADAPLCSGSSFSTAAQPPRSGTSALSRGKSSKQFKIPHS
jgi:hypothetical protein